MQILFVTEKWCDFNPHLAWTNNFHNLFSTFSKYDKGHVFDTIHIDEAVITYDRHIDEILPKYVEKFKPDIIFFCLLNGTNFNPSIECYKYLKSQNIFLCVIWPDTGPDWGMRSIKELNPIIDLHISFDNPKGIGGWEHAFTNREPNHFALWTPEDEDFFHLDRYKTIDISWLGTLNNYRDRLSFQEYVRNAGLKIYMSGGQREAKLTPSKYANIIRKSKIGINFPMSQTGVFFQAKGRIFEYIASGGLLFDIPNPSTNDFFEPDKEYVTFNNFNELKDKLNYYITHEQERLDIVEKSYTTFRNKWTSNHWWDKVFALIEERR